jgi:hypothetical protein
MPATSRSPSRRPSPRRRRAPPAVARRHPLVAVIRHRRAPRPVTPESLEQRRRREAGATGDTTSHFHRRRPEREPSPTRFVHRSSSRSRFAPVVRARVLAAPDGRGERRAVDAEHVAHGRLNIVQACLNALRTERATPARAAQNRRIDEKISIVVVRAGPGARARRPGARGNASDFRNILWKRHPTRGLPGDQRRRVADRLGDGTASADEQFRREGRQLHLCERPRRDMRGPDRHSPLLLRPLQDHLHR